MSPEAIALRLDNLCKSFGRIRAVDHLSLEVYPGEMVGFLGPNGAGKSTTLYMITSLVHPSAGKVEIFGRNVRKQFKESMKHVGVMLESPAFYEYLSGRTNLELMARLRDNVPRSHIDEIFKKIGLSSRQRDKVATYSLGMKQRLALGGTLLGNPRLLLLDEPTSGMDPEATREILTLLRTKVNKESLAVFLSSHLLYEVEEFCDRVIIINEGKLIASGNVSDILAPHDDVVRVTFRGSVPDSGELIREEGIEQVKMVAGDCVEITLKDRDSTWLNTFLLGKGYTMSALVPRQKTLKDFFLSVTGDKQNAEHDTASSSQ